MTAQFPTGTQAPQAPAPQAAPMQAPAPSMQGTNQFPTSLAAQQAPPTPQAPAAPSQQAPSLDGQPSGMMQGGDPNAPQFGAGSVSSEPPTDWQQVMQGIAADDKLVAPTFNPDLQVVPTDQLQQFSQRFNPTQGVELETVQNILANQDAQGLMDLLNNVGRGAYTQAIDGSQRIAQNFATNATTQYAQFAGGQIQSEQVRSELIKANPNFTTPQQQGHFREVFDTFSRQFQGAELQNAVSGYFNQLGGDWQVAASAPLPTAAPTTNQPSTNFFDF